VIASGQRDADVAVGPLPADLAGAEVGRSAFAVDAAEAVVVADGLEARVEGCLFVLELRLSPSRLANDVALPVADIPVAKVKLFNSSPMMLRRNKLAC